MRRAQPWLGTLVEISVLAADSHPGSLAARSAANEVESNAASEKDTVATFTAAVNAAFAAVALVHRRMSFHDPDSDIAAINRLATGASVQVDPHTAAVLRSGLAIEAASEGLFNIACGSRLASWGYLPHIGTAAADGSPARTDAGSGGLQRQAIMVDAACRVTRLQPGWIDLGGIAKGYAVDLAVDTLRAAGVEAGCVNAGGDLRAFGPMQVPVHIRDPGRPTHAARTLSLRDAALATSATYFSRREVDGLAYSALIDGSTGTPIVDGRSASVQAATCMLADALTKVVMATGDAAHPLLARMGASAFIIGF